MINFYNNYLKTKNTDKNTTNNMIYINKILKNNLFN